MFGLFFYVSVLNICGQLNALKAKKQFNNKELQSNEDSKKALKQNVTHAKIKKEVIKKRKRKTR